MMQVFPKPGPVYLSDFIVNSIRVVGHTFYSDYLLINILAEGQSKLSHPNHHLRVISYSEQ